MCLSISISVSLCAQSQFFQPCLSRSLSFLTTHLSIRAPGSFLLLPLGPSLSKYAAAQGLFPSLPSEEECCLSERAAFRCDRTVKRQTCDRTRSRARSPHPPAVPHACLQSVLRQILGKNSICRGDESCDRGEEEEMRIKGNKK